MWCWFQVEGGGSSETGSDWGQGRWAESQTEAARNHQNNIPGTATLFLLSVTLVEYVKPGLLQLCFHSHVLQLIAAYSTPPAPLAPPEAPDFPYDSARLDFKDSDMKRLSMEIERERWDENTRLLRFPKPI